MRRLRVKLYSILREEIGASEIELEVPDNAVVDDLLRALEERAPVSMRVIGGELRVLLDGVALQRGDPLPPNAGLVHVLPPSSGGSSNVNVRVLRGETLNIDDVVKFLEGGEEVGALAIFIGVVRGVNKGERVSVLRYELAEGLLDDFLVRIGKAAAKEFALSKVFIAHYVGSRRPGELTMVVGVSARGRDEAFPALRWIVDKVKHEAPIWKEEVRETGRYFILGDKEVKAEGGPSGQA